MQPMKHVPSALSICISANTVQQICDILNITITLQACWYQSSCCVWEVSSKKKKNKTKRFCIITRSASALHIHPPAVRIPPEKVSLKWAYTHFFLPSDWTVCTPENCWVPLDLIAVFKWINTKTALLLELTTPTRWISIMTNRSVPASRLCAHYCKKYEHKQSDEGKTKLNLLAYSEQTEHSHWANPFKRPNSFHS